jgi:DEAD/DEAH box helicase domain-containing protein
LITNPDMLHLGLLAFHDSWKSFFANLAYVVLDEVHAYKGIFGSHIAQVILRMRRVCAAHGAKPRFIACSATVANPGEFVSRLIGEDVAVVDRSGAPCSERHFLFLNPVLSPYTVASRLLIAALDSGCKTIVFTRARKITELITTWVMQEAPRLRTRVSSYRAGFLPEERREIEAKLFSGKMDGVISTSALEMGIDVGGLDLCLLVGYPGTIINTWQRGGRVGRSGRASAIVLIAGNDALDQYFLRNPHDFFERTCEEAVLDPLNEEVLKRHLPCAAAELPLRPDEAWTQQTEVQSALHELEKSGSLYQNKHAGSWHSTSRRPHRNVDLRSVGDSYSIFLEDGKTLIGSSSGIRAFTECHEGAVYLHRARQFLVTKLDLERRNVLAKAAKVGYYTRAQSAKETKVLGTPLRWREYDGFTVREARLEVTERIIAYEKRRTAGQELIGVVDLELPPLHFETVGIWIEIPDKVKEAVSAAGLHFMGGIHAMEHAAISMFPLFALCDRDDIGGISTPEHEQVCRAAVFIYDGHPGGVGLSHRAFDVIQELLQRTLTLVETCPCDDGCPSCIHSPKCGSGNKPLDKRACMEILKTLLSPSHTVAKVVAKKSPAPRIFPDLGGGSAVLQTSQESRRMSPSVIARSEATKQSPFAGREIAAGLRPRNDSNIHNEMNDSVRDCGEATTITSLDLSVGAGVPAGPGSMTGTEAGPTKKEQGRRNMTQPDAPSNNERRGDARVAHGRGMPRPYNRFNLPPKRIVVFDLETQKLAQDVGGWKNISKMGLAVGVAHTESEGFLTFTEDNVNDLISLLKAADLVVGFNHLRFDYEVLKAYTNENLRALPNLDILVDVQAALGHRLNLNHLAHHTLQKHKSGDGLEAIRWFREGRLDLVEQYCKDDVAITRDLYLYGVKNGYLLYERKSGGKAKIRVKWGELVG